MPEKKSTSTEKSVATPKSTATKAATTSKSAAAKQTATAKPTTATTKSAAARSASAEKSTSKPTASAPKTSTKSPAKEASATKEATKSSVVQTNASQKDSLEKEKKPSVKKETQNTNQDKDSNTKVKLISILTLIGFIVVIGLIVVCILCVKSCSANEEEYINPYSSVTRVGYEAEVLGTVKRNLPTDVKNEGRSTIGYPKYGSTLRDSIGTSAEKKALRQTIINESNYLTSKDTRNAGGGGYNRMTAEGQLYLNDTPVLDADGNPRFLYKHTASEGLYLGDVSDDEPGVIKRVTLQPRGYDSYSVTGVYAPAGEVIKIEISAEDMEATSGIIVHIGQALYNRKANNIWADKNVMNRMPHILNTMVVTKDTATYDEEKGIYTAYVGSFMGGPVYIHNENVTFSVTISGAVNYSHFILGYTTKEEFEENAKSTAPYFDLEVWEYGVLHSGPNYYAKSFSYDDLYDAAILWEKISLVSTQIRKNGIVFLYDPFVAAGAAVAFPGQNSVNCPMSWMPSSLNYKSFVNGGAWGNMHEYNHNFQGFGVGNGGEVTNNSLNLVSYSLFTRISSSRKIGTVNEGLSGWNAYTNASWALREITENRYSNGKYGLAIYANMLHNFGQDAFLQAAKTSGGQSVDKWFVATMNATHYDMTYFYKDLIGYEVSTSVLNTAKENNYPMFVPVSSIYQTGRSYTYDGEKRYTETMQPYVIPYGEDYEIDLNQCLFKDNIYQGGSIVLPEGFTYKIKNVSQPENGTIKEQGNNIYTFTPNDSIRSGKIYVTLEITKNDKAFEVEDVELALEFEQSHEMNKTMLERTTYTFSADKMYASATDAFEAGYANYATKVEGDNQNPILNGKVVQNGNAEVWYTEASQMEDNQIVEIKGKLYSDEAGKYRIALRGRYDCALYVSVDGGKTYELAAKYLQTDTSSADFPVDKDGNSLEGTYKDYELTADTWLYFKAVLVTRNTGKFGFIGVGWGKFTPEAPILDAEGNEIETIPEYVKISYASALRESYEFNTSKFESDYYYKRTYSYSYRDNKYSKDQQTIVTSANYSPWNKNDHKLENLVDGKTNTYIHTNYTASETKPLVLVVDLGEEMTANQMTMWTQYRPNGDYHCPTNFKLEGSLDGETYFEIGAFKDAKRTNTTITVDFEETTFRYYRLTITKSSGSYIILSKVQFGHINEILNGKQFSLDDPSVKLRGNWEATSVLSTFGHSYNGKKNSTLEFEFEGTRFGILSSNKYAHDFEVYIDGNKIDSIVLKEDTSEVLMTYISSVLEEGKHTVLVKCVGDANIDSIIYW